MIHSSSAGSYRSPCFVYNFFRNVYFFFMGSDPNVYLPPVHPETPESIPTCSWKPVSLWGLTPVPSKQFLIHNSLTAFLRKLTVLLVYKFISVFFGYLTPMECFHASCSFPVYSNLIFQDCHNHPFASRFVHLLTLLNM